MGNCVDWSVSAALYSITSIEPSCSTLLAVSRRSLGAGVFLLRSYRDRSRRVTNSQLGSGRCSLLRSCPSSKPRTRSTVSDGNWHRATRGGRSSDQTWTMREYSTVASCVGLAMRPASLRSTFSDAESSCCFCFCFCCYLYLCLRLA